MRDRGNRSLQSTVNSQGVLNSYGELSTVDCELLAPRHIVTSQVEHSSVLNYCMALEKQSQDSPQSTPRSRRTAHQSASVFSVPSVVNGSSYG